MRKQVRRMDFKTFERKFIDEVQSNADIDRYCGSNYYVTYNGFRLVVRADHDAQWIYSKRFGFPKRIVDNRRIEIYQKDRYVAEVSVDSFRGHYLKKSLVVIAGIIAKVRQHA